MRARGNEFSTLNTSPLCRDLEILYAPLIFFLLTILLFLHKLLAKGGITRQMRLDKILTRQGRRKFGGQRGDKKAKADIFLYNLTRAPRGVVNFYG